MGIPLAIWPKPYPDTAVLCLDTLQIYSSRNYNMRVFFGTGGLGSCGQRRLQFFPIWCAKRPGTRGLDVFASKSMVQEIITCAFSSGLGDWALLARGDFNFFLYGVQKGPGLGDLMFLPPNLWFKKL